MAGSGFSGDAECTSIHVDHWHVDDGLMNRWAAAGYVTVAIEYHGYEGMCGHKLCANDPTGLHGDQTYPGVGQWEGSDVADATVQLDIKAAAAQFLATASQYGGDPSKGLFTFGGSSGAHDAYMLALTGLPGYRFGAAIGWSGGPDQDLNHGSNQSFSEDYMQTTTGSDVMNFADPFHRISASSPPQYIADSIGEFISWQSADGYYQECVSLALTCWERMPNTSKHAEAYASYKFTGNNPAISTISNATAYYAQCVAQQLTCAEFSNPPATVGSTVTQDSIQFANTIAGDVPTFTSVNNVSFVEGSTSLFVFGLTGTPYPKLTITSGTLPAGVVFGQYVDYFLYGTPTQTGTFPLTLTATNSAGMATQQFTLTVTPSVPATPVTAPSARPS
jgi:hypothetical protein